MLSKEDIDKYLGILGEEILSKFGPEANVKVVIVGGAAIALNYRFRESTMDIDTYIRCTGKLDDIISEIAKTHGLEDDWLNSNVTVTQSYTSNIEMFSPEYKVYSGVLHVHVADALTLVCMKAVSCRPGSHDLADIDNILTSEPNISYTDVCERFIALYGDWSKMSVDAQMYLQGRFSTNLTPDLVDYVLSQLPPSKVAECATLSEKMQLCEKYKDFLGL